MFFNDGVASDDICLHLSVEKVYVPELNTSLVLFQASLLHNDITIMMMQWVLRIALVVSIILLAFSNRCSTNGLDLSLRNEVLEGIDFIEDIQEAIPGDLCSEYGEGLHHLRKQAHCCRKYRKTGYKTKKCTGENLLDVCLRGLDVASRYIPFFDREFKCMDDDEIQNISNTLKDYDMSYTNRLGQCIRPVKKDKKKYEVSFTDSTDCDRQSLILVGLELWTISVGNIYDDLNQTINNETETQLDSLCQEEEDRRRKRELKLQRKQEKEERKRRRKEKKEENKRRRERKRNLANQSEDIVSSTPDCI